MEKRMRNTLLIGVASLISVGVLLLAVLAVSRLTLLSESPADFLPADRTIALLHSTDTETKQMLVEWFPELHFIEGDADIAIAVVALPGGGRGSVTFRHAPPGTTEAQVFGPYLVEFSDAIPLLSPEDTTTPRLSSDPTYAALAAQHERNEEWMYIQEEALPKAADMRSRVLAALLFGKTDAIGLRTNTGGLVIDRYFPERERARTISTPPLLFPGTFLTVAIPSAHSQFQAISTLIPAEEQLIIESMERTLLETYVGKTVSWQYDMETLLGGETTLYARPGENRTDYVLLGTVQNREMMHEILERLHTSFVSMLPTSRAEERTFDEQFPSTILRSSDEQIIEEERTIGSWRMRVVRHATEDLFFITAKTQEHFALSNSAEFLEEVLQRKGQPFPAELSASPVTSMGVIDTEVLGSRTAPLIPETQIRLLPQVFTGAVLWSTSQQGSVETLRIISTAR